MTNTQLMLEVVELAKATGDLIMSFYKKSDLHVESKSDSTLLTEADEAADAFIHKALAELTPDIPVLSEESANISYKQREQWPLYWLVDPLDGTRDFVEQTDDFTVNIALVQNHQPIMGVVHAPARHLSFWAAESVGALAQFQDGTVMSAKTRTYPRHDAVMLGSRRSSGKKWQAFHQALGEPRIERYGSALKVCLVCVGEADVYPRFGPTSEWDTAASQIIIEQAGGALLDTQMRPLQYNKKASLRNPYFIAVGDVSVNWQHAMDAALSDE